MKTSHYTTPRTLADAQFATWADPIERPAQRRINFAGLFVLLALAVAAIALGSLA